MKGFLLILMLTLPTVVMAQECADYREGSFMMVSENNRSSFGYFITRKKKFEKVMFGVIRYKWKIDWTSECTYNLTLVKAKNGTIRKGTVHHYSIQRIDEDGIECTRYETIDGVSDFTEGKITCEFIYLGEKFERISEGEEF